MSIGKSKFHCKGPTKPLGLRFYAVVGVWPMRGLSRRDQAIRT
jgi:hypothetical protein